MVNPTEWADIKAIQQENGPSPICPIAYEEEYRKNMDYFRAIARLKEYSSRVLTLTKEILEENASHYTVWKYRLDCVRAINASLEEEVTFLNLMAEENPKSYQVWHHRQAILELLPIVDPLTEMAFINQILVNDSKNYHAWSYRQGVVKKYALWEWELNDVDRLIKEDVRNNSAWNQRYYIITDGKGEGKATDEELERELKYSMEMITLAPNNESPWNYLRGILNLGSQSLSQYPLIMDQVKEFADLDVRFALVALLDMKKTSGELKGECMKICQKLIGLDPVRENYWKYLISSQFELA